jgi:hypothetical protein
LIVPTLRRWNHQKSDLRKNYKGVLMFEFFGILVRLPFFIIGIIMWKIIGFPLWIFFSILGIILIPFRFIGSALSHDKSSWNEHLNGIFNSNYITEPYNDLFK